MKAAYIFRYHGKCLKIARGKVKGSETFTCPICDWRVKIPRDAARPKLEDLQQWAEELATLPFQPDEEDILERIIDKAQSFRDFLQQFINGNQICRTSEEMPTILFYLRKIEGAEVLLAYETNIFRQDVHKWQPIAPIAPPILEQSLSTRKPRPTKQQKMMKELGVQKIEDLPPHMRKQQAVKRKPTDPLVSNRPTPPSLQPAQGGQSSNPSSQLMRSDTPLGLPRQGSTGNAPNGAPSTFVDTSLSFSHHNFGTSASSSYASPHRTASPAMFSPTTSLPSTSGGMRESSSLLMGAGFGSGGGGAGVGGGGGAIASGPGADSSPALFSPGYALGGDDDIRTGIVGATLSSNGRGGAGQAGAAGEGPDLGSSSPQATNVEEMFMEMTNEDPDGRDDDDDDVLAGDERDMSVAAGGAVNAAADVGMLVDDDDEHVSNLLPLEQHPSQASEALEMIGGVGVEDGGVNGVGVVDGDVDVDMDRDANDHDQGAFDEFLNGGDG
jgi:endogenous inhibitor of DNA gyrase (YacG/DUF329 family)